MQFLFFNARRVALPIGFVALILIGLASCTPKNRWQRAEGAVWNTTYHIAYDAPTVLDDSIQAIFRMIDNSVSAFNEQSIVSQINHGANPQVDDIFKSVFEMSKEVNLRTGGLFDPTVSPIINLWKFGYTGKVDGDSIWEPTVAEIDSALALVGIQDCNLLTDNTISVKAAGTTFNFSAIAKGYACDLIAAMLRRNGATGAMVEIGGEISLFGKNPAGEDWHIQIDAPEVETDEITHKQLETIEVTDCGIATSGNYRNYHMTQDGRVGHTISPLSGRPVMGGLLSVTVIAPTCALADAYATAIMASGNLADALPIFTDNSLRGVVVSLSAEGNLKVTYIDMESIDMESSR